MRESPALPLIDLLHRKGAVVSYADPFVPTLDVGHEVLEAVDPVAAAAESDCVVIVTAHGLVDHAAVAAQAALVFDTRNVLQRGANIYSL
jgi:UDP-N-acetyl-D-glucosamine dehydrogenase